MNNQITRIVLTGGPCAGKTTTMAKVIEHFSARGYKVFAIPEVPTIFTQAGMNYLTPNADYFFAGEKGTLEVQMQFEDSFYAMAKTLDEPVLIVSDRGTMGISSYMKPADWQRLLALLGTSDEELLGRYDAIIHLKSAAHGAEKYYNTFTNAQRYETADEEGLRIARMLDDNELKAWTPHPYHTIIETNDDFDYKMQQVIETIENILK